MAGDLSPLQRLSQLTSLPTDLMLHVALRFRASSRRSSEMFTRMVCLAWVFFGAPVFFFFRHHLRRRRALRTDSRSFCAFLGTRRITDTSTWSSSTRRPTCQEILDDTRLLQHGTGGPAGSRTCEGDSKLFYNVVVNTNLVGIISRTTLTSLTPQRRVPGNAAMFRECDFVSSIGNLYDHECPISCGMSPMDNENVLEDVPSYADVKQWGSDGHESGSAHFEQSVKSASQ